MLTGFSIIITPDGLKAYLQIPPKTTLFPTEKDLYLELKNKGIITGLDPLALSEIANGRKTQGLIEIAKGIPPKAGSAGKIEILFDITSMGKPKAMIDGRVDHHEISSVINVKPQEKLAQRIPPTEGAEGINIFGKPVPPPSPDDVMIRGGHGTIISSDNPNLLVSTIEGAVTIDLDGVIEVKRQKIIEKDIDYSTGNISFAGDLIIKGSVRAGFFVEVQGDLHVCGNVEDTRIKSGGCIEIDGGAVGAGTGLIESVGFVKVRHLENFSIRSGSDVFINEDALHSSITSEGKVKAKSIIGGSVNAFGVECEAVGSTAETKTVLDIGRMHKLIDERVDLEKKFLVLSDFIKTSKIEQFTLVRDSMDENGSINEQNKQKLDAIKNKTVETKKTCDKIRQRIDTINELEKNLGTSCGISANCIYPNTFIKFGNGERQVQDILRNVKLTSGT